MGSSSTGEPLATIIHRITGKVTTDNCHDAVWFLKSSGGDYYWVYKLADARIIDPMSAEDTIKVAWWLLDNLAYRYRCPQGAEMCHFVLDYFGEGMCALVALENA